MTLSVEARIRERLVPMCVYPRHPPSSMRLLSSKQNWQNWSGCLREYRHNWKHARMLETWFWDTKMALSDKNKCFLWFRCRYVRWWGCLSRKHCYVIPRCYSFQFSSSGNTKLTFGFTTPTCRQTLMESSTHITSFVVRRYVHYFTWSRQIPQVSWRLLLSPLQETPRFSCVISP